MSTNRFVVLFKIDTMKLYTLLIVLFLGSLGLLSAQTLDLPKLSPLQKIEQKVGLTDVVLEYSRPSMRGRKIFGELLEYGEYWRMGANKNTKISIGDKFMIDGDTINAGEYALFCMLNKDTWEVFLYDELDNWGLPDSIEESKILASIKVPVRVHMDSLQTLTYSLENLNDSEFDLTLSWETKSAAIPITILTKDKILSSIDAAWKSHAGDYYVAARYYYDEVKDYKQADEWIKKSIALRKKEAYWCYALEAEILAELGEKKSAVQSAQKALDLILPYKSDYHTNLYTDLLNKMKAL